MEEPKRTKKGNIEVVIYKEVPEEVYRESLGTENEKVDLVKRIEKIVRSSGECRDYTFFLKKNMDMDSCAFFHNISKSTGSKVRIEIHHAPLTLFDIAYIILEKAMKEGEEIDDLLLAEEVAEAHYNNIVGLIPLSKTLHELVHPKEGEPLTIPLYMVYGNYVDFLKKYRPYWEDNDVIKAKLDRFIEQTREIKETDFDMLKEQFTYIKVDGFEMPVKIGDVDEKVIKELNNAA